MKLMILLSFTFVITLLLLLFKGGEYSLSHLTSVTLRNLGANMFGAPCEGVPPNFIEQLQNEESTLQTENYLDSILTMQQDNSLYNFIIQGENEENLVNNYIMPLINNSGVWIFMFCLTILMLIAFIINWFLMYCKCCESYGKQNCRRCLSPNKRRFIPFFAIGSSFFGICIIVGSMSAMYFSEPIPYGGRAVFCNAIQILSEFQTGNIGEGWMGMNMLYAQLNNLTGPDQFANNTKFGDFVSNFTPVSTDFSQLYSTLSFAYQSLRELVAQAEGQSVIRPDPAVGGNYTPWYSANLGPNTSTSSFSGAIMQEMAGKNSTTVQTALTLNATIGRLWSQQNAVYQALLTATQQAESSRDQVNSIITELTQLSSTMNNVLIQLLTGLAAVSVTNIIVSLGAICAIILVLILRLQFFSKVAHMSWFFMGILSCLTWVLTIIFYPTSIYMRDVCEVVSEMFVNGEFFNQSFSVLFPNSSQTEMTLSSCLYGDPDIMDTYQITGDLKIFATIYTNTEEAYQLYTLNSSQPVVLSNAIPIQVNYLQNVKVGRYSDSNQSTTDLATLNSYTNAALPSCSSTNDSWVWSDANCSSSVFIFPINGSDWDGFGSSITATCLGFDIWIANGNNISDRYNGSTFSASCPTIFNLPEYEYLEFFITNYVENRNFISTLYGILYNYMIWLQNNNTEFMYALENITEGGNTYANNNMTITNVAQFLYGTYGLLNNTNCSYIQPQFIDMAYLTCNQLVNASYDTTIALIVTSFFTLFGTFFMFCLAKFLSVHPNPPKTKQEVASKHYVQMRNLKE